MFPAYRPRMRTAPRFLRILMLFVLLAASLGMPSAQAQPSAAETASHPAVTPAQATSAPQLGVQTLPSALAFVPAGGRGHNDDFRFEVRGAHGTLFLTPRETVFALPTTFPPRQAASPADDHRPRQQAMGIVRQRFVGAAPHPKVSGLDLQPGVVNEYLGERPEDWRTQLPSYGAVQFYALYPGVNLRYDGTDGQLKRSFLLAPGADASAIQWQYQGVDGMQLTATGDLQLQITVRLSKAQQDALDTSTRTMPITMTERAPRAWQDTPQGRVAVPVQFVLANGHKAGFALGAYDHGLPLVIDPAIVYTQTITGNGSTTFHDLLIDVLGQLVFVGSTTTTDFSATGSGTAPLLLESVAFASALNLTTRQLAWTTRLGDGSHSSAAWSVTQGTNPGNLAETVALAGETHGSYPVTVDSCTRAALFVTRLNTVTGAILASRCLTGTASFPHVYQAAIGSTRDDQLWVATNYQGDTGSLPVFPQSSPQITPIYHRHPGLLNPGLDIAYRSPRIFVVRLSDDLHTIDLSVGLGGTGDYVRDLMVDGQDRPVLVGKAGSTLPYPSAQILFPTTANAVQTTSLQAAGSGIYSDMFATRLSTLGGLDYSTLLSGTGTDEATTVALTTQGEWVVGGFVRGIGSDLLTPTTAWKTGTGGSYVARITTTLTGTAGLRYGSLVGSGSSVSALAVQGERVTVVGESSTGTMFDPVTPIQPWQGGQNGFVAQLDMTQPVLTVASFLPGYLRASGVARTSDGSILVGGESGSSPNATIITRIGEPPRIHYYRDAYHALSLSNNTAARFAGTTTSYYEYSIDPGVHYDQGCTARQNNETGVIILFYGLPRMVNGQVAARLPYLDGNKKIIVTNEQIQAAVRSFAEGYTKCAPYQGVQDGSIVLAVTVTNSYDTTETGNRILNPALTDIHGRGWAHMVSQTQEQLYQRGIRNVRIAGGYDAEPSWWQIDAGSHPEATLAWAQAYNSTPDRPPYYFIGSLDGGPRESAWVYDSNRTPNPLYEMIYTLAWDIPAAIPLPQVYYASHAKEWYQLRYYTLERKTRPLFLAGLLTGCGSTNCTYADPHHWTEVLYNYAAENSLYRHTFSPSQGATALYDMLHTTLISDVDVLQPLLVPTNIFQLPSNRVTDAYDPACQPRYLIFNDGGKPTEEPQTTILKHTSAARSCLPVSSLIPQDTTLLPGWRTAKSWTSLIHYNPKTPQQFSLVTDICRGALPGEPTSGTKRCVSR